MEDVRIAYGVAGPIPMRAAAAEACAKGKPTTREAVKAFAQTVLEEMCIRDRSIADSFCGSSLFSLFFQEKI